MNRKFLVSVLASVGILLGGAGMAYAFAQFHAQQQGFREAGSGQAAHVTIQVEAGIADPNSALFPDDPGCLPPAKNFQNPCPGGALSFSIANTSDVPVRVTGIDLAMVSCGIAATCPAITSNKNSTGSFAPRNADTGAFSSGGGDCNQYAEFQPPFNFDNWPTIGPGSTLQVNGTDGNQLGAGMLHLASGTPSGCQGATFSLGLRITAVELGGQAPGGEVNP
jgi:hypothetical protein